MLGVHRSGTSCLAHLLNVLGAKLPAQLVGPSHANPFGHWEPARLQELNEEILGAIGRSWDDPRPIPAGWFCSATAYAFQERLRALIVSEYRDAPLMLIKEPRICRLAPLYLDVLDTLGIKSLVVLPVRHPGEVIRSIHERDRIDPWTIELLWLRNLLEAEEATRACKRVWTSFDQLLDNWEKTAQSIAAGLSIVWPNLGGPASIGMQNILKPRYRHHRIADDEFAVPLDDLTIRAWQAAGQAVNGDEATATTLFIEIDRALSKLDRFSAPQQQFIERQLARVKTEAQASLAETEQKLGQAQARGANLASDCERLNQGTSRTRGAYPPAPRRAIRTD